MSGDVQLELWMNEYKLDALAAVLARENTTVEQRMQDVLTELYVSLVPRETRQEISARIKEELAARDAEMEASRKCAVFHVRENGREEYFRLDQNQELLDTARTLRRYLRQEPGADSGSFSELFPRREAITPDEFERLVLHHWRARRTLQRFTCWSSVSFWFSLYKPKTRAIALIRCGSPRFLLFYNLFRIARTYYVIIQQNAPQC